MSLLISMLSAISSTQLAAVTFQIQQFARHTARTCVLFMVRGSLCCMIALSTLR